MLDKDNRIAEKLMPHRGHTLECVSYGEWDDPADVCIECIDCNEVLVSAEDFNEPPAAKKKFYGYFFFAAEDEDMPDGLELVDVTHTHLTLEPVEAYRQNVADFQSQFDDQEAYVDKWGVIHIVTAHEDRPFAYYFEVIEECWEDVLGSMGQFLDDSENKDMPEAVRKGFAALYDIAYAKVFPEESKGEGRIGRDDLPEFVGQIIDIFEDFLEEKGIDIENDEKDERDDPESVAIIYGTDYGILQSAIEETLIGWGLTSPEDEEPSRANAETSAVLLREVEDSEIYGILLADGPDVAELTAAFLSAKGDVARIDPEWQVADILARLPKEWNARVEMPGSIYI